MTSIDERNIRRAIEIAASAREHGNHPFGAVLTDSEGNILLTAENTVVTDADCTGHAETNLIRKACKKYDPDFLATCSLYTSTEPCPMCVGAIFWGNVRRVVFGLSESKLYELISPDSEEVFYINSRQLFGHGKKQVEIIGPVLEEDAIQVHLGFWDQF